MEPLVLMALVLAEPTLLALLSVGPATRTLVGHSARGEAAAPGLDPRITRDDGRSRGSQPPGANSNSGVREAGHAEVPLWKVGRRLLLRLKCASQD